MTVQALPCPTCGKATPISNAPHLPFCSERCRLIDLGRWLDEDHALPAKSNEDQGHEPEQTTSVSGQPPIQLPPGWHDA